MIHRIKVGGDKINRARQPEAAISCSKKETFGPSTVASGHRQHFRRSVHTKDRHIPTLVQIAGEESGAATDVGGGAKSYIVPLDEPFEGRARSNEVRHAEGGVIR